MYNNQTAQGAQDSNKFSRFNRHCGGFGQQKFGRHFMEGMQQFTGGRANRVPVNIEEDDAAYYLHVYAAGLKKENFTLSVKEEVLSISYKAEGSNNESKFSHQEFVANSFERLFQLNSNVVTESISAAYADGVLKVTLPKNPETAKPAQKVTVN
ncbi:MAG: Hsp20/alpha crystallin family protein [Ferruginibacter sp.]|nr:Hsp20/alpha crystallin family protein [Ferruginibacter sp.]